MIKTFRVFRIITGIFVLIMSLLMLASGLIGTKPILIYSSHEKYIWLTGAPPHFWLALSILGLFVGLLIILLPRLLRKIGHEPKYTSTTQSIRNNKLPIQKRIQSTIADSFNAPHIQV